MSYPVENKPLHVPDLQEVATILQAALKTNFAEAEVTVVDCPDLTQSPFGLSSPGLCGSPRLADVGGVPYLMPLVNREKLYDINELARLVEVPDAFIVGAGAGPHPHIGVNSEMMANIKTGAKCVNGNHFAKINEAGNYQLEKLPSNETRCALMLNMFASEGKSGKVLRVHARKRTGETNLVSLMRQALEKHYGASKSVGLGGAFRLVSGKAKCHVMPDFSPTPLTCDDQINEWLRFYDFEAPMVFLSTLCSVDPGLDLRIEHTHGYGKNTGGHYHYDTTPESVEYEGYFNIAEFMYRIDRPATTHQIGRN